MSDDRLFGVLPIPPKATHCVVHETDKGKMGQRLAKEIDGQVVDKWPIGEVTREFVLAMYGPGTYRFAWIRAQTTGEIERMGASGNMVIEATNAKVVANPGIAQNGAANGHAASPAPAVPGGGAMPFPFDPTKLPPTMLDQLNVLGMYVQLQSVADARANAFASAQVDKERVWMTMCMNLALKNQGAAITPEQIQAKIEKALARRANGESDDDDEDTGLGKWLGEFAKGLGAELKPLITEAIKGAAGGST